MEKEIAILKMKERGYESTSINMSGEEITSVNFIKRISAILAIHAKVKLKSETVSLYFVELKYFCKLSAEDFDLHHKDFEKYEQIICMYAAKCLDIDIFGILDSLKPKPNKNLEAVKEFLKIDQSPKSQKKDIKERKREFWDEIVKIGKDRKYPKEECKLFYIYWTQMNPGGIKLNFEITKAKKGVFDIGGRLATWMKNNKEWTTAIKNVIEKKAEKQNKEIKNTKTIDKTDLF